ncbi:MAG: hypothetical protein RIF32_15105 [Leptospirales bacterium]|jgi:hypothetical protein
MKQSKQQPKPNPGVEDTIQQPGAVPSGFSRARAGFREIGGQVTGFYRYLPGNRAEIIARFQHREQIARVCQRLQLRLEAEFDLAALKQSESRKRARHVDGGRIATAARSGDDAGQLNLLEAGLAAFSGDPAHAAKPVTETRPRKNTTDGATSVGSHRGRTAGESTAPGEFASAVNPAEKVGPNVSPRVSRKDDPAAKRPAASSGSKAAPEKRAANPRAPIAPRSLEESLSEIRPLGPASLKENERRADGRNARKKRDASA